MNVLKVPLDAYEDVLTVLKLEHFSKLMGQFDFVGRRSLSVYLLQSVLDKEANVTSTEEVRHVHTCTYHVTNPKYQGVTIQRRRHVSNLSFHVG